MNYREAFRLFKRLYPNGTFTTNDRIDRGARRLAWGYFTDELCKSGHITPKQFATWSHPYPSDNR